MQKDLAEVTDIAKGFLTRAGHPFQKLEKADPNEGEKKWRLIFRIGAFSAETKTIIIDDTTGKVISIE